jgi:hypothetical protein
MCECVRARGCVRVCVCVCVCVSINKRRSTALTHAAITGELHCYITQKTNMRFSHATSVVFHCEIV